MAVSLALPDIVVIGDDETRSPSIAASLKDQYPSSPTGQKVAILIVGKSENLRDLVLAFRPESGSCLEELKLPKSFPQNQYGDLWIIDLNAEDCQGLSREGPLELGRRTEDKCGLPG
jgi:hypothetical protein